MPATRYESLSYTDRTKSSLQVADSIGFIWLCHHTGRSPQLPHQCSMKRRRLRDPGRFGFRTLGRPLDSETYRDSIAVGAIFPGCRAALHRLQRRPPRHKQTRIASGGLAKLDAAVNPRTETSTRRRRCSRRNPYPRLSRPRLSPFSGLPSIPGDVPGTWKTRRVGYFRFFTFLL